MSERVKHGKAMLLISLKPDASRQDFQDFYSSDACGKNTGTHDEDTAKSLLMDESEIAGLPHQVLMAGSPPPFDAVYQLRSSDTRDLELLGAGIAEMVEQLNEWIDRSRSALLVGTEVAITRGWGPIRVVMPLRRRPELSHDDFMQSWYGRHASIGEAVDGVRYRQNHVDPEATTRLSKATGITFEALDGVTESFFPTAKDAIDIMVRPEVAVDAIEDEKQFIDHRRSQFGFYRLVK